jgi:hypothetical protein
MRETGIWMRFCLISLVFPLPENWNYALSETVPLQAGRLYRLSAWVKVTSAGSKTPMPFLKCEFVAADRNREIGRAATGAFDAARLGQWQHLTGEFRAPAGAVACWIALEKGTLTLRYMPQTCRLPAAIAKAPTSSRYGSETMMRAGKTPLPYRGRLPAQQPNASASP